MKSIRRTVAIGAVGVIAIGALSACTGQTTAPEADGPVTLTVAIDAGLEQSAIDAFDERIEQFMAENEDITIERQEYNWDGTTFTAALAGGTLPDVFTIPFTDGRGLIERKQIADVSELVAELPYADDFNPNVAQAGQAADGAQWAIPIAAYGQGLHYNRTLFEAAGLDPDAPPQTWDEVREAAKAISDATGEAGYAQMTSSNTGGWILTTLAYALGGSTEDASGDEPVATIDSDAVKESLELIRQMRWEDDSMGSNFLYDWGTINQDFASGRIGMYVSGGGNYGNLVTQNALDPDDYGVTVLPLDGDDAGVLGGGTLAAVSASASEAERAAAVKWIDFYYIDRQFVEEAAVTEAKVKADLDQPVGAPEVPIFSKEVYDAYLGWVDEYINVPTDQMAPYTDNIFAQPILPEPRYSTQEIYALLDPVVQAVLTDENADIDSLLSAAQAQAEAILAKN